MSNSIKTMRPFISVTVIIASLLTLVFFKMEARRLGYSILHLNRIEKTVKDDKRMHMISMARLTRPDRIESLAQTKLALSKPHQGQIVQIAGEISVRAQ